MYKLVIRDKAFKAIKEMGFNTMGKAYDTYCECIRTKTYCDMYKNGELFLHYNPRAYTN